MRSGKIWWIGVAVVLGVIGYAWINGGREPLHEISEPIPMPTAQASTTAGDVR